MENTKRRKGRVPFGYEEDPEDPRYLKAIPNQLEVLEEVLSIL